MLPKPFTKAEIIAETFVKKAKKQIKSKIATGTNTNPFKNLGVSFLVKNKIVSQSATVKNRKYVSIYDKLERTPPKPKW